MTLISSKPTDDDPITEVRVDGFGNEYAAPSKLMATWMEDVSRNIRSTSPFEHLDSAQTSALASVKQEIDATKQALLSQIQAVFSTKKAAQRDSNDVNRMVYMLVSQLSEINNSLNKLDERVSNLEQVAWQ